MGLPQWRGAASSLASPLIKTLILSDESFVLWASFNLNDFLTPNAASLVLKLSYMDVFSIAGPLFEPTDPVSQSSALSLAFLPHVWMMTGLVWETFALLVTARRVWVDPGVPGFLVFFLSFLGRVSLGSPDCRPPS